MRKLKISPSAARRIATGKTGVFPGSDPVRGQIYRTDFEHLEEQMQIHYAVSKKLFSLLLILFLLTAHALAENYSPLEIGCDPDFAMEIDQLSKEREEVWNDYRNSMLSNPVMQQESAASAMTFGDAVMRYYVKVIGSKPQEGYPLYIAMHGGGSSDTPDMNDDQWNDMKSYYADVDCGVYVAVRGVRDTWDTHFNPESYPLYDRLIQYMILLHDVNPNRVYLEGFSAGGDGVYAVSPRMPDRFAAVNMSSGHPNGIPLYNLYNLPIQLQAGEYDTDYNRNTVTAEYGMQLDSLQLDYGGFEHRTLIHTDCGHNYNDWGRDPIPVMRDPTQWLLNGDRSSEDVDSFPPDYMNAFVRNPLPSNVMWDLSTRANTRETETFYYLSAPYETNMGFITAMYDRTLNVLYIQSNDLNGPFSLLLNENMVDFSRPISLQVNENITDLVITPDRAILVATTYDRGDPFYQFEAELHFDASGNLMY